MAFPTGDWGCASQWLNVRAPWGECMGPVWQNHWPCCSSYITSFDLSVSRSQETCLTVGSSITKTNFPAYCCVSEAVRGPHKFLQRDFVDLIHSWKLQDEAVSVQSRLKGSVVTCLPGVGVGAVGALSPSGLHRTEVTFSYLVLILFKKEVNTTFPCF